MPQYSSFDALSIIVINGIKALVTESAMEHSRHKMGKTLRYKIFWNTTFFDIESKNEIWNHMYLTLFFFIIFSLCFLFFLYFVFVLVLFIEPKRIIETHASNIISIICYVVFLFWLFSFCLCYPNVAHISGNIHSWLPPWFCLERLFIH